MMLLNGIVPVEIEIEQQFSRVGIDLVIKTIVKATNGNSVEFTRPIKFEQLMAAYPEIGEYVLVKDVQK